MNSYRSVEQPTFTVGRVASLIVGGVLVVLALVFGGKFVESVDADEILVVQDAIDGELHWHTTPGVKPQWFGRVTKLPKVLTYQFEGPIRFNEGGHGKVVGSIQFRLPMDSANLTDIYTTFGNSNALSNNLLSVVTDKSIFMTGPLLSSTESYAEKRSNLIFWIEDQIVHGVYRTTRRDIKIKDPITGEEKTATVAEIATTKEGEAARQEISQLSAFGVQPFNFAVSEVSYDETVEKQIQQQQMNIMAVQTAAAESRRAEQQALTAEQQGKADATKAKWAQETIKAQKVTEAQQRFEVARLDAQAAAQERQANILRGEGEAARRRLLMQADNALDAKLQAYVQVMSAWAENVPKYQGAWVPSVVQGGDGRSQNGAQSLIDLLSAKTARDLGLDLTARRGDQ